MNAQALVETAMAFVAGDKGLLAMDKVIQAATNALPNWGFPRANKPGAHGGS